MKVMAAVKTWVRIGQVRPGLEYKLARWDDGPMDQTDDDAPGAVIVDLAQHLVDQTGNGPAPSRAQIGKSESRTALPGDAPYPVVTVSKVPPIVGQPLLAAGTPEVARRQLEPPVPDSRGPG